METPHRTASGTVEESPLVLIDVLTNDGGQGHGLVFTYNAAALKPTADLVTNLAPLVEGEELAPAALEAKLAGRFRLLGTQGLLGMALAGIDMAFWDAFARTHNRSLLSLLGGAPRSVPAYGAIGYDGPKQSGGVAEDWARRGFKGVKAKIGYPSLDEDRAVIRGIRSAAGPDMAVMVDYNQSLTPADAVHVYVPLKMKASPGSKSRHSLMITAGTLRSRSRSKLPSNAARTGGAYEICSTRSKLARATI